MGWGGKERAKDKQANQNQNHENLEGRLIIYVVSCLPTAGEAILTSRFNKPKDGE